MTRLLARAAVLALVLPLAGCTASRPAAPVAARVPARPAAVPQPVPARTAPAASDDQPVGRWIAVDVVGDDAQTRDLRRGVLEKTLVVNPGGHVILRGVDRAPGGGTASFTGTLVGRVLTFADLPGAAILSREGTRLVLSDPTGRQTRFVRDAD